MKKLFPILTTLLVLAVSGCTPSVDIVADRAAIRDVTAQREQAWNDKDVERVLSFNTEDSSWFPPNAPIATGQEAMRALFSQIVESPGFALFAETTAVEVSRAGDVAYSPGVYEITVNDSEGNPITTVGKWVSVWKKQADGSWKVVAHIWNPDGPAASE